MNMKQSVEYDENSRFNEKVLNRRHIHIVFLIAFLTLLSTKATAEFYAVPGGKLGEAQTNMLIEKGFCKPKPTRECFDLLPTYVDHDFRVQFYSYEVSERNINALMAVIEFTIREGIRITDGAPIRISAYRETQEERRKSGLFFSDVKPFLILEVNK